jgi:lysozyme
LKRNCRNCALVFISILALQLSSASTRGTVAVRSSHIPDGVFLEPRFTPPIPSIGPPRQIYPKGILFTKKSEGWSPTEYNDSANNCTIGYGHLIKLAPCNGTEPAEFLKSITIAQGTNLLMEDMSGPQAAVSNGVTVSLTDGEYASLCDFAFNVGPTHFLSSTLLKVINANQFDQVATQMRRWIVAGGKNVPGLLNRRNGEIALFFDGQKIPSAIPAPGMAATPVDVEKGEQGN